MKIGSGFVLHVLAFMPNSKLLSSTYYGGNFVCIGYGVMQESSTLEIRNSFLFPQFFCCRQAQNPCELCDNSEASLHKSWIMQWFKYWKPKNLDY
jgi:hypothetical protein